MNFVKEDYNLQYSKGVKYIDISLADNFKTTCWDMEYTGKVETDFVDDTTFCDKQTLIHLYGRMYEGILKELWAEAQFSDNSSVALKNSLFVVLNTLNREVQFRPYRKFI